MTCEKVGFFTETIDFSSNISEDELLKEIERLNSDERFDGILVQLPLPKHIDELKVLNAINPDKDVDGFHFNNIGKMVVGDDTGFLSCTPYGIIQLLDEYNINVEGKDVVIIGRSNIVGKPMALLLIQKRATVQVCNTRTKDMREKLKNADIVISAAGVPNLIGKEDVWTSDQIFKWNDYTNGICNFHFFQGGHFYLSNYGKEITHIISHCL